jgi:hypothetical protein
MFGPARNIVVILLSVLGAIVPVSGVVVGWRYPRRQAWTPDPCSRQWLRKAAICATKQGATSIRA